MSKRKNGSNQELVEQNNPKLKQYAEEVNQLQTEIASNDALSIKHGKVALNLVIKAGGILNEAKKLVKHGGWGKWVSENVTGISKRTAENYMKLAKKAAETQYVALLDGAQSLREAYIRVGIINEKPDTEHPDSEQPTPENAEGEITPEKMKKTDKVQYDAKLNEARQKIRTFVRNTIDASKRINWNLSTWTIKNNKPCSGDGANCGAALFRDLQDWVAKREFSTLTREDEVCAKAGIVLSEVVTTIILANTMTKLEVTPEVKLMDIVPPYSMELDRQPVEVVEMTPA
ncbi:MAG: DUF3102 domain-containing protein [Verrucomicrobiia bacterium]